MKTKFSKIFLEAQFGKILNTKLASKIMLIISKLFKVIASQIFTTFTWDFYQFRAQTCLSQFK
jgi:hypothetical protein